MKMVKIREPDKIDLRDKVKVETNKDPTKIQAGDLISIEKAIELVKEHRGEKFFRSPFWLSLDPKKSFPAKSCMGCDNGDGKETGLMLVIGYRVSNTTAKKSLIRACYKCGCFTSEEFNGYKPNKK